jgi:hypothetical protein
MDLPPGLYANYARIRGTEVAVPGSETPAQDSLGDAGSPSPRASQPYCRTVHGARRLLQANRARVSILHVPILPDGFEGGGWLPCEGTEEACSDGIDNDHNDLADCAEPGCAAFCEKEPCASGEGDASSCVSNELQ